MNNLGGFGNPVAHIVVNDRLVPVISRKAADLALMKDTYCNPVVLAAFNHYKSILLDKKLGLSIRLRVFNAYVKSIVYLMLRPTSCLVICFCND